MNATLSNHTAADASADAPTRIGELLGRIIPLSNHDIEEILNEQQNSNRRFGEVALQLGLCRPEHVLQAWLDQLESHTPRINLDSVGVDAQATLHLPAEMASEHQMLPLRVTEHELLIAVASVPSEAVIHAAEKAASRSVKIVLAEASTLRTAITRYYGRSVR